MGTNISPEEEHRKQVLEEFEIRRKREYTRHMGRMERQDIRKRSNML